MRGIFHNRNNHIGRGLVAAKNTRSGIPLSLMLVTTVLFFSNAFAAGDAQRGKEKSATCTACHGEDGNSINPEWPSIAGQHPKYLTNALLDFKSGQRSNVLMSGQATALDDQAIEDLAAYFATQKSSQRTADPKLVEQGERLYRGGNLDKGLSACTACHGPSGRGNPGAGYPVLAGQHATYTANQLLAYRAGERQTDAEQNQVMRNIAALMSDKEIRAVASYIQGLQ
jgi:cytochrome c553